MVGRRLGWAAMLLGGLAVANNVLGTVFTLLVSGVLVALPILQWVTAWFFWQRARENPEILTLRVRTQDAVALAVASSTAAILGALAVGRAFNVIPAVDRSVFLIGLSFSLLMTAAPAINWLAVWKPWKV